VTHGTTEHASASRIGLGVYGALGLVFLSGPLLIVIPMSFSSSDGLQFPPPGWSTRWYAQLFSSPQWAQAVKNSFAVGIPSSLVALVLGGLASYGLVRFKFRGRGLFLGLFMAPLIIPPIVTAVALFLTFSKYGLRNSLLGVTVGHIVIVSPYVVLLTLVAFQTFDFRIEQIARSLGGSWLTSFRTIVLPMLAPTLLATWLIAFVVSFDEIIVTIFVAGNQQTVPKLMFSQLRDRIDPTVTALSTLLVLSTAALMMVAGWLMRSNPDTQVALSGLMVGTASTPTEEEE
jgi:putative spermidine/putrescine transport system permease protein